VEEEASLVEEEKKHEQAARPPVCTGNAGHAIATAGGRKEAPPNAGRDEPACLRDEAAGVAGCEGPGRSSHTVDQ